MDPEDYLYLLVLLTCVCVKLMHLENDLLPLVVLVCVCVGAYIGPHSYVVCIILFATVLSSTKLLEDLSCLFKRECDRHRNIIMASLSVLMVLRAASWFFDCLDFPNLWQFYDFLLPILV